MSFSAITLHAKCLSLKAVRVCSVTSVAKVRMIPWTKFTRRHVLYYLDNNAMV